MNSPRRPATSPAACPSPPRSSTVAKEADVNDALVRAGFNQSGQSDLFDGRTGEKFARPVTVGIKYLLKAPPPRRRQDPRAVDRALQPRHRSSLSAGKAQFGGPALRRDGGLGARKPTARPTRLQEMLTVKSGRRRGPDEGLRVDRQGRGHLRGRRAGKLQRARQGSPRPRPQHGTPRCGEEEDDAFAADNGRCRLRRARGLGPRPSFRQKQDSIHEPGTHDQPVQTYYGRSGQDLRPRSRFRWHPPPSGFSRGPTARSRSPKRSTIARSSPSAMALFCAPRIFGPIKGLRRCLFFAASTSA